MKDGLQAGGVYQAWCYAPDGTLKWETGGSFNKIPTAGLAHILDILFVSGTSQVDPWYIGLTDGTPTAAAGDTLASHAGWTEVTDYDEAARQEMVDVRSTSTVSNSASKASFSINADSTTIGGAFLASASTGTSGTLLSVAAFTGGDKSADDGDTLEVQYDFSASSST